MLLPSVMGASKFTREKFLFSVNSTFLVVSVPPTPSGGGGGGFPPGSQAPSVQLNNTDYLYINWNNGTYAEMLGFSWPSERYCGPNKNGTLTSEKLRNISYYLLDWKSKNSNLNNFTVDAFLQANFLKARFNANGTVEVFCAPTAAQQANITPYIVVMAGFVVALGIYFAVNEEMKKKKKIEKKIRKAIEKEENGDDI